jgi:hypothetical protein
MDCQQNIENQKYFPRWDSRAFGRFGVRKEAKMLNFKGNESKTSFYHLK